MYRRVTYNSRINSDDLIFYDNLNGDRGVDYIAPSQLTILSQKFKPNKSFLMIFKICAITTIIEIRVLYMARNRIIVLNFASSVF